MEIKTRNPNRVTLWSIRLGGEEASASGAAGNRDRGSLLVSLVLLILLSGVIVAILAATVMIVLAIVAVDV